MAAGVTVGVMSDSYQCNPPPFVAGSTDHDGCRRTRRRQDVPPGVEVLDNGPCPGSDEGRGMVQLVHDVAPGAAQKFHTAFNSLVDFADGILELQEAGSDVIVDDVIYFAENMFSDGIIAQAADHRSRARRGLFLLGRQSGAPVLRVRVPRNDRSSINGGGNNNGKGAPFVLPVHDFDAGAGTDTLQKIHVTPDGSGQALVIFSLQWDQPFLSSTAYAQATDPNGAAPRGATGDLDMLIYTDKGVLVPRCPPGVSTGITCQLAGTRNVGGDAVDLTLLFVGGPKSKTNDFFVRIARVAGEAPAHVKYVMFEQQGTVDVLEHDTQSGTAYGHANAANVASIGASSWYLTEEFDAYFSTLVQDAPGRVHSGVPERFLVGGRHPDVSGQVRCAARDAGGAAESARDRARRRQHDILPRPTRRSTTTTVTAATARPARSSRRASTTRRTSCRTSSARRRLRRTSRGSRR